MEMCEARLDTLEPDQENPTLELKVGLELSQE